MLDRLDRIQQPLRSHARAWVWPLGEQLCIDVEQRAPAVRGNKGAVEQAGGGQVGAASIGIVERVEAVIAHAGQVGELGLVFDLLGGFDVV